MITPEQLATGRIINWQTRETAETGVYSITHKDSGKRYIGSASLSVRIRWNDHLRTLRNGTHCNRHLQSAFNKDGDCYNIVIEAGKTWLGGTHGPEARRKLALAQTGRRHTEATKAKMRAAKLGRKLSPEQKAKLIEALKRRNVTAISLLKRSIAMTGQKRTPEQRARVKAGLAAMPDEAKDSRSVKQRAARLAYIE